MRYVPLEVSLAGCFGWLCTLCFTVLFHNVFPVTLTCAGVPCQLMHTALCLPPPPLCSDAAALCSLFHRLHFKDFVRDLMKCCVLFLFFIAVNEGQLILLNFSKEASTTQKLIMFLFLVDLFCVDLFASST